MVKIIAVDDDKAYLNYLQDVVFPRKNGEFDLLLAISNIKDKYGVEYLLEQIHDKKPNLVLMDLSFNLVGLSHNFGIELVEQIKAKYPEQKVIMLVGDSGHNALERGKRIVKSFEAGAEGYLEKREIMNFRQAIADVNRGNGYMGKDAQEAVIIALNHAKQDNQIAAKIAKYKLTDRHLELLFHLCEGKDLKTIAESMVNIHGDPLDRNTVAFHLSNIRTNLFKNEQEGSTLHGIVAKVLREGIIK